MKFRTEISNPNYPFLIRHGEKILLVGSCFSDNIGKKLEYFGFDVLYNPFGVVYNPSSIAEQLLRVINQRIPSEDEYLNRNDLWHHFDFHSVLSGTDLQEVMDKNKKLIKSTCEFLKDTKYLFLTLGTSIIYKIISGNKIVANNHKYPADYFSKQSLKTEEIVPILENCFSDIFDFNPDLKIIMNISPVRHLKDGLIENQRSKAALILATEELTDNSRIFYFPSYEIMMDDLRDYRYYAEDLIHPIQSAIEYIWEKFSECFFEIETMHINQKLDKINKALLHRPLFPETNAYNNFRKALEAEIQKFKTDYPFVKLRG